MYAKTLQTDNNINVMYHGNMQPKTNRISTHQTINVNMILFFYIVNNTFPLFRGETSYNDKNSRKK